MPDTIRQQIMDAVKSRLQTIRTANGYRTDIGAKVVEWPPPEAAAADLPEVVYRDVRLEPGEAEYPYHAHLLGVQILVAVASATPLATARAIDDDLRKAIGTDPQWGAKAINTLPPSSSIEVADEGDRITGVTLEFQIQYRTNQWLT